MTERLSKYFEGLVFKRLSAVETSLEASHQHEFNGTKDMQLVLGENRHEYKARFLYLGDSEDDALSAEGTLTWYDARAAHPTRSEWRLYYKDSPVFDIASEGDLLLIAKTPEDELIVIVAQDGSTGENQIRYLFQLPDDASERFTVRDLFRDQNPEIGFASRTILSLLDIETNDKGDDWLDEMLARFDGGFPTTRVFSEYARGKCKGVDSRADPDEAVLAWLSQEERLFKALEEHLVWQKVRDGFGSVDDYISSSLSVLNRRKSRAGHAAENHLEQIFLDNEVKYSRGATTEGHAKPDFLFPGIEQYRDAQFPDDRLLMLGVKTTCKDRWRQVLAEASRVTKKHLFTLEPGVSENQTDEMRRHELQLVLPRELHLSYKAGQQGYLMTLRDFVAIARGNDRRRIVLSS